MARSTRRSKQRKNLEIWEESVEVPNPDLPDARDQARKVRRWRWAVRIGVAGMPFYVIGIIVALGAALSASDTEPVAPSAIPQTQAHAIQAVDKWLSTDPQPLPGGQIVSWDSYEQIELPETEDDPGYDSLEVHKLTLSSGNNVLFRTSVQIVVDDIKGISAIGTPTLIPIPPTDTTITSGVSPWPALPDGRATEGVETAIEAWAEAYTSGDPAKLRQIVGDSNSNHSYVPLAGITFDPDSVSIKHVAALWGSADRNSNSNPPEMLVNIEIRGAWAGQGSTLGKDMPTFSYDLLLTRTDTATPVVVAWGGTGTGQTLEAYSNAVVGRNITKLDSGVDTSKTPTPGSTIDTTQSGAN